MPRPNRHRVRRNVRRRMMVNVAPLRIPDILGTQSSWPTYASTANWRQSDSDTPNIDAYDCYLRGRQLLAMNPKNHERFE